MRAFLHRPGRPAGGLRAQRRAAGRAAADADQGDRQRPRRHRHRRGVRGARRAARHRLLALSVAGTAVLALRSAAASLQQLMYTSTSATRTACTSPTTWRSARTRGPGSRRRARPTRRRSFDRIAASGRHLQLPGGGRARRCTRCRSRSAAARWSPSWGRTARARPPSPRSSPGCTGRRPGRCCWDDVVDRRRGRRAAAGADRGHRPGPRELAADACGTTSSWAGCSTRPCWQSAAAASGADTVIAELARGYDTLLARQFKDGAELSGGQWQRIAAARGFYRTAPLLIMDEPTAALDARAEYALFSSLRTLAARPHGAAHHPPAGVRQARRPHLRPRPRQGRRVRHARRA